MHYQLPCIYNFIKLTMTILISPKRPKQTRINIPKQNKMLIETLKTVEIVDNQEQEWLCRDTYYRDDNYY